MPTNQPSPAYPQSKAIVFAGCFLSILLALLWSSGPALAAQAPEPFFLMGSGRLQLKNLRNNRETRVELRHRDGSLNDAADEV